MRTTIRDIAAKTGLSVTTISLVLNNKPSRISEKTKRTVMKVAKELNYRPNQAAVNLKINRSQTIGLIVSDIRNDFFASFAKGMEDACRRSGWNVILCNTSDSYERETEYIEVLDSKGVDGIVLNMSSTGSYEKASKTVELLKSRKIPFVLMDRSFATKECNAVMMDSETGGYLATRHLLELGHKRIACVTGPMYLEGSSSRLKGYRRALGEAGIEVDSSIICHGNYTFESGIQAMEMLIDKKFSAVFAFNDMMAFGVYQCARTYQLSIPRDLSLVGCDDVFMCSILDTPLTTVHQPFYQMGETAGNLLIDVIEGRREQPATEVFTPNLVVRKSTRYYME